MLLRGGARPPPKLLPPPQSPLKQELLSSAPPQSSGNLRLATNLFLWWSLNVLFNIANKECMQSRLERPSLP